MDELKGTQSKMSNINHQIGNELGRYKTYLIKNCAKHPTEEMRIFIIFGHGGVGGGGVLVNLKSHQPFLIFSSLHFHCKDGVLRPSGETS